MTVSSVKASNSLRRVGEGGPPDMPETSTARSGRPGSPHSPSTPLNQRRTSKLNVSSAVRNASVPSKSRNDVAVVSIKGTTTQIRPPSTDRSAIGGARVLSVHVEMMFPVMAPLALVASLAPGDVSVSAKKQLARIQRSLEAGDDLEAIRSLIADAQQFAEQNDLHRLGHMASQQMKLANEAIFDVHPSDRARSRALQWSKDTAEIVLKHPLQSEALMDCATASHSAALCLFRAFMWEDDLKKPMLDELLPEARVETSLVNCPQIASLLDIRNSPPDDERTGRFARAIERILAKPPRSLLEAAEFHELDHLADRFARRHLEPVQLPWAARHDDFEARRAGQDVGDGASRMAGFLFRLAERKQRPEGERIDPRLALLGEVLSQCAQGLCGIDDALRAAWEARAEIPALELFGPQDLPMEHPPTFADLLRLLKDSEAVHTQLKDAADSAWSTAIKEWERDSRSTAPSV